MVQLSIAIHNEEGDKLSGTPPRPRSDAATIISAAGAVLAIVISVASLIQTLHTQNQLNQQEASQVYLGEAPAYAYAKHPPKIGYIWWVVMNNSPLQINDVWVEGKNGRYVRMWGVQGCSMYAVPQGFKPVAVDYTDSIARWRHPTDAQPQKNGKPFPSRKGEKSPWYMSIENCS